MCDDEIHQGIAHDVRLSRRAFGVTTAAVVLGASTAAQALVDVAERDVDIKTPDGMADCVLFHPTGGGSWPAVLIWTDILGLRPVFRQMGRRLASQGYVVLVPNPFYRVHHAPIVDDAFDISKPEDRAKVLPLAAALTPETTIVDATTFFAFLDSQAEVDRAKKAGVQGYCMGGPLTFRTAAALPERIAAAATFHGGSLVTAKPDSPHLLIPKTRGAFYCAVADNDDTRDPEAKTLLRDAFAAAHRGATVEVYEGANHGWCVKGSHAYDEAAAERAWSHLTALYASTLA